jgi:hypothetical protein
MKTELLHKYFRGETTEKEENQIVEWVESSVEQGTLSERANAV